jgi:hypothetical protein
MNEDPTFKRLVLRAALRHVSPMVIRVISVSDRMDLPVFNVWRAKYTNKLRRAVDFRSGGLCTNRSICAIHSTGLRSLTSTERACDIRVTLAWCP